MWDSAARRIVLALVAWGAFTPGARAQEMTFDSISGDYLVSVTIDGTVVTRTLVPANKLDLTSRVSVDSVAETGWVYRWMLRVSDESPQALATVHLPCPGDSGAFSDLSAIPDPGDAGPWYADHGEWAPGWVCMFMGGAVPVEPGQALQVRVETDLAPRIGTLAAVGANAGFSSGFPDAGFIGSGQVYAFESQVSGITGGWKSLPTLVPGRSIDDVGTWNSAWETLSNDLGEACGELGWIPSAELCSALAGEVSDARELASAAAWEAVRTILEGVAARLTQQPAEAVHPDARLILGLNVARLLRMTN